MRYTNRLIQILLGLMLIIFGSNKFFQFIPVDLPEGVASEVMIGFVRAGYLMPFVAILEISIGIMFVLNKFAPVAALLLTTLSVNFVGFHLSLDIAGIAPAAFVFLTNVYFIFLYRKSYTELLKVN